MLKTKTTVAILLTITAVVFNLNLLAQDANDTCTKLNIVAPAYLVLNDTSIHILRDTSAVVCDKYILLTKKNGYSLYSKLLGESQKHHLVNKLFQLLIASSTQDTALLKEQMIKAEDVYTNYSGKIIRKIDIKVLKPFGASLTDTNLLVVSTWGRALNKSHVSTQKRVLKRKLMFKEHDTINPLEIVENTRELSNLPYLQDATIVLTNVSSDSVDVLILVKDKFPWLPAADIYDISNIKMTLQNVNIVGLGQSVGAGLTMNTKSKPVVYLSDVNYSVNNIYKQISGGIGYHVSKNDMEYSLYLNRDIIPLSVRWGGGTQLSRIEQNVVMDPTDVDKSLWFTKYNYAELWSTYLFYAKSKTHKYSDTKYYLPGIAMYHRDYIYRPYVSIDSNSLYSNYTTFLTNIALVSQSYFRLNYFTDFGRAEYLPYGFRLSIIPGYTWSEFGNLPYLGFEIVTVSDIKNFGYAFITLQAGSHFSSHLKQGAVKAEVSFLSNLLHRGRYKYRIFARTTYTTGINRITNDLLYLGEDYGFIGMQEKAWYGKQRLFFETDFLTYTPWYIFGFRFGIFAFGSVGMLGTTDYSVFNNQILASVGTGVYLKNDFLAFNSIQFRVAYFPVTPDGISHFGISFSTIGLLHAVSLLTTKPQVVEYK